MSWKRDDAAPPACWELAKFLRPKLGQACAQIGMGTDAVRYALVFDNPADGHFWWQALAPTPAER